MWVGHTFRLACYALRLGCAPWAWHQGQLELQYRSGRLPNLCSATARDAGLYNLFSSSSLSIHFVYLPWYATC